MIRSRVTCTFRDRSWIPLKHFFFNSSTVSLLGGAGKSKSVGGAKVRAGFEGKTNAGFLNKNGGGGKGGGSGGAGSKRK